MDVVATLLEITAYDPVTGTVRTARVTNRNDPRATTGNGQAWLPILSSAPTVGVSVFDGAFTGVGQLELGGFSLSLVDGLADWLAGVAWTGADIKVYAGPLNDAAVYTQLFRAVGNGAQRTGRTELKVELTTRASLLDVNVLVQSYAGTGLLEGHSTIKGVMKPWVFGFARFCKPVLIDPVRQIYQVSAYGPIEGVGEVYEGGQAIAYGGSYSGTVNDFLTGAGPAQGTWRQFPQYGLIRLGSQPLYDVTCDVYGDSNGVVGGQRLYKAADIIGRVLALTSTIGVNAVSLGNYAALQPEPVNDYFASQTSVASVLANFLLGAGGYYTFNEQGQLIFGRVRFGTSTLTLSAQNDIEPAVLGINQLPTSAPIWDLRVGAEQCHFVHSPSEIVGAITSLQQGVDTAQSTANSKNKTFPPSSTPPAGPVDGDQWPDTSVSPTTMRRYNGQTATWVAVSNQITTANQVPYSNGQSVEALRPAQPNADVTGTNQAASIYGQGYFATQNYADFTTRVVGAGKPDPYVGRGDNLLTNADLAIDIAGWDSSFTGSMDRVVGSAGDPVAAFFRATNTTYSDPYRFANNYQPIPGSGRIFVSAWVRTTNYTVGTLRFGAYQYTAAGAESYGGLDVHPTANNVWQFITGYFDLPTGTASFKPYLQILNIGSATYDIAFPRFAKTENAATVGGRFGLNVRREGGPLVTDLDAITSLGTAAAIAGQAATATSSDFAVITGSTKPEASADVTQITTGPASASPPIARNYDTTPKTGELPRDFQFKTTRSTVDVSMTASWAAVVVAGSGTATFTIANGVLNVTAASDGVQIVVSATVSSKTTSATPLSLGSTTDPAPTSTGGTGGGTSSSTSTIAQSTGNTYGASNSGTLTAAAGSGGKVDLTFYPGKFKRTTPGTANARGKWRWRAIGGSFVDVAAEINSTSAAERTAAAAGEPATNQAGNIAVTMSKTGLTPGTSYEFELYLRADVNVPLNWTGTAAAAGG